jgi:hypothetical protein
MMPKHSLSARRLTALLAVSLLTLAACDSGGGGITGGTNVEVVQIVSVPNAQTLTNLTPGHTRQMLGVPTNSEDQFVDKPVTYATSNAAVFTVSGTGVVTAVAGGTAYLRASAGGRMDSVLIGVRYPVASVTVSNAGLTLRREGTQQLTVTTIDTQGATVTGRPIIWSSDAAGTVSVSATGLAAAQPAAADASTATITATANNASDNAANVAGTRLITVNGDAVVASVTVTGASTNGFYGDGAADLQLTATALSGLGNPIAAVFVWTTTSAPSATVSGTGLVNFVAPGTPTIRATTETFAGSGVNVVGSKAFEVAPTLVAGANAIANIPSGATHSYAYLTTATDAFTMTTDAGTSGDADMAIFTSATTTWTWTSTAASTTGLVCASGAAGNVETCNVTPALSGWYRVALVAWTNGTSFTQPVQGVTLTVVP